MSGDYLTPAERRLLLTPRGRRLEARGWALFWFSLGMLAGGVVVPLVLWLAGRAAS